MYSKPPELLDLTLKHKPSKALLTPFREKPNILWPTRACFCGLGTFQDFLAASKSLLTPFRAKPNILCSIRACFCGLGAFQDFFESSKSLLTPFREKPNIL